MVSRRVGVSLGAILLLAIAASVVWFVWLPRYRPALRPWERYGVDVSHHQGPIDWSLVAADGISFAYIKATEGATHTDTRFERNWTDAGRHGLDRGAYHFFSLCSSGQAQARRFLDTVPEDPAALPPALDLELTSPCEERPDEDAVRHEVMTFLRLVERDMGERTIIYLGDDFAERYPFAPALGRPRWVLSFLRRPDGAEWVVWQVGGFARVDGIEGNVDLDVMPRRS